MIIEILGSAIPRTSCRRSFKPNAWARSKAARFTEPAWPSADGHLFIHDPFIFTADDTSVCQPLGHKVQKRYHPHKGLLMPAWHVTRETLGFADSGHDVESPMKE